MRKLVFIAATAAVAAAVLYFWHAGSHGHPDYRDPVQLARAVESTEHTGAASCAKLPTGKYMCFAANADGSSGEYMINVSPDGSSWSAS